jgi:hypothetical protein
VGIDSGYNTIDVYNYCREHRPNLYPTKGFDEISGAVIRESVIDYRQNNNKFFVDRDFRAIHINTNYFKDELAADLKNIDGDKVKFCANVDGYFLDSLAAEAKIRRKGKEIWVPRYSGIENHFLDTSIIARAIAEKKGFSTLKEPVVVSGEWSSVFK